MQGEAIAPKSIWRVSYYEIKSNFKFKKFYKTSNFIYRNSSFSPDTLFLQKHIPIISKIINQRFSAPCHQQQSIAEITSSKYILGTQNFNFFFCKYEIKKEECDAYNNKSFTGTECSMECARRKKKIQKLYDIQTPLTSFIQNYSLYFYLISGEKRSKSVHFPFSIYFIIIQS